MPDLARVEIIALVRSVRRQLRENVATFGARFYVSGRTVENWEQGHRMPPRLVVETLLKMQQKE